jgi:outer membrane immunogenic protein
MRTDFLSARSGIFAVVLAAALTAASAAQAADAIVESAPEPPLPPAQTNLLWSGPYIGIYGGYNWMSASVNPGPDIDGIDGLTAGGYAGFNFELDGGWVAGVEAMGGFSDGENTFNDITVEQNWDAALRARFGYAFGSTLAYGLAGYGMTSAEATEDGGSDSQTHLGWTIGAGLETQLLDNVTGRIEYNYSKYGEQEYDLGANNRDISLDNQAVKVGVGLKF